MNSTKRPSNSLTANQTQNNQTEFETITRVVKLIKTILIQLFTLEMTRFLKQLGSN